MLLRAALEQARIGCWEWMPSVRLLGLSAECVALAGEDTAALAPADGLRRVHPEDRERLASSLAAALSARETALSLDLRLVRGDGSEATVCAVACFEYASDGTLAAAEGIVQDLTQRRAAESELRHSEARWRQMAEAMPQLVWTCTPDGPCDYLSPQWAEYTGRPVRELLGYGWLELLHPEDRDRVATEWQRRRDGVLLDAEYRLRRYDGAWRWFKARAVPARDTDGIVTRWYGSSTDVHDLRSAEEAVREADRRKTEFLATLSHELRNPLAPIRYALELLDRRDEDGRLAAPRQVIARQLAQLVRLVDDLLDVTRIASNKVRLQAARVDVASVVRNAVEAALPNIERAHHHLQVALPAEREWVDGDPDRLAQVVTNLLNNAARYTPPGGRIQVSAAPDGAHVVLTVADTGVGLLPGDLERVFDIFAQAGDPGRGGLGIGLAIVKGIVELHGGVVEARSAGPGRGAEFRVTLPRAEPPACADEPAPARTAPGASRRILVVDDNPDAAEMMRVLLELAGHEVRVAHDAATALAETAAFRPDMGLFDIGLPDMDGCELARLVRREPSWRGMYLVAITGWGQLEDRQRALSAGFDAHLTKPADPEDVQRLVARARRRREE